eukprot:CAMPEP_0196158036 /NCGR_PEP_ID=MMETSP0910-20130528/45123_1 /TAXON_ID=49265 /ORGANISM="Thalassiosira rotula, Strain GSO102" /LENGTH=87 /DNA_ID=CAMNT_0041422841 /DNA_START=53 /DNA_END=312 /DNA_ORIENTATION=+
MSDDGGDDNEPSTPCQQQPQAMSFSFNGNTYNTYQEMVDAKRKRNRDMLASSGLLEAKAAVDYSASEQKRTVATVRGLKRSKTTTTT